MFIIPVPVDIKPGSCPNPLQMKGGGVLPAAILGTDEFDLELIDPETVTFWVGSDPFNPTIPATSLNVTPLRWNYEDVATPYDGEFGDCMSCTTERKDGYTDLTLKFNKRELTLKLAEALSLAGLELENRDCLVLTLRGELEDDTPFMGQDVVRIQMNRKGGPQGGGSPQGAGQGQSRGR
jgi:hypothetical protein